MKDEQIEELISEIKEDYHTPSNLKDSTITNYIKEGIYELNENAGTEIDYIDDLKARSLLKERTWYAYNKMLPHFKENYGDEYAKLQIKYSHTTDI